MKFINESDHNHLQVEKTGVLLTNLGTPDSWETSDVRRYLREFLWDPRVVEVPRPVWWMVLNLFILTTRPSRSAKAYQKIWTEEGSPLLTISQQQADRLRSSLDKHYPDQFEVVMAMRYGNPSIADGLQKLREAGVRKVLVFPLYPQYSATTTASTFDAVTAELQHWRWIPELRFINHYHDTNDYISSLEQSIRDYWQEHGKADKLIMSFHGIPKDYLLKGDPYYCECQKTARLLADRLGLAETQWQLTFQSRLGAKEWLKPYTDKTLQSLGREGLKSVQVICPGFSADCLETLEEIAMENRDTFLDSGGESYQYIPCLNAKDQHIDMMQKLVERHVQGWDINTPLQQRQSEAELCRDQAVSFGAEK